MKQRAPNSLTEAAIRYQREAYVERLCKPVPFMAPVYARKADELLVLPGPPEIGPGGEVVRTHPAPEGHAGLPDKATWHRRTIRDTLAVGATRIAEDASIQRADLLMQSSFDAVAMGIDAAESIQAANSVEKMLAHQMAVAHEAAMRMMDRGLSYQRGNRPDDAVEACRCTNAAARLMSAFNDSALTLQRLRTGGSQTVTVQHVTVASGGQAVIGNVQPGGKRRGSKRKNG